MQTSLPRLLALATLAATLPAMAGDYRISGPYTHENLSVYLIHGPAHAKQHFLTLQEALAQKKAIVYETGHVNELAIENVSDQDIFVQSGDIVKGGQQDRTLKDDLIIPTKSGKVAISSFCVEHGRWSRRGQETVARFDSAPQAVATREMKKAVKLSANQSEVWDMVAQVQRKLSATVAGSVAAPASPTSFMLSLENPKVRQHVEEYMRALLGIVDRAGDVTGYAFAVNGQISSADVYGSGELFRKLWPKLLRASAVEAIAAPAATTPAPPVSSVQAVLADAESGKASQTDLTQRTRAIVKQTGKSAMFETRDQAISGAWVHRSYLVK